MVTETYAHCSEVFFLHRRSKSVIAHENTGFPSFSFTTLCRSHVQRASASRDSVLGMFASTSVRKSTRQTSHGYKSANASKNLRAWMRCRGVGSSYARRPGVSRRSSRARARRPSIEDLSLIHRATNERNARGNSPRSCASTPTQRMRAVSSLMIKSTRCRRDAYQRPGGATDAFARRRTRSRGLILR